MRVPVEIPLRGRKWTDERRLPRQPPRDATGQEKGGGRRAAAEMRNMVSDRIEKLRQEYADKYVVVEGDRPELARFKEVVGQVRTINFSSRALVQFDANNNRGWYDIGLDYLRVVDKPEPKPSEPKKKAAAKAEKTASPANSEGEKKLSPLELARMEKQSRVSDEGPPSKERPAEARPEEAQHSPTSTPDKPASQ